MRKYKYKFVNIKKTKAYNSQCKIMVYLGGRGIGKTFGIEAVLLEEFFKSNDYQIVRFVRTVEQVSAVAKSMANKSAFNYIYGSKYTMEFENTSRHLICGYIVDNETGERVREYPAFIVCAIKKADDIKLIYPDYSCIKRIDFFMDEIVLEQGEYLPNEWDKLFSAISSLLRKRKGRLYLAANTVSIVSPILCHLGIDKYLSSYPYMKYHNENKEWCVQIFPSDEYEGQKDDEGLLYVMGNSGSGSKYWDILQGSNFTDSMTLIQNLDKEHYTPYINLEIEGVIYGIRHLKDRLYVTDKECDGVMVYVTDKRNQLDTTKVPFSLIINDFRDLFDSGAILFKDITTKDAFLNTIKY